MGGAVSFHEHLWALRFTIWVASKLQYSPDPYVHMHPKVVHVPNVHNQFLFP